MHTSCNFLSAILYHPSLSAFSIYHPDSGWYVTSSDQGLSFPEERAWERGWGHARYVYVSNLCLLYAPISMIWGHARYVYVSNLCLLYLWLPLMGDTAVRTTV